MPFTADDEQLHLSRHEAAGQPTAPAIDVL